MNIINSSVFMKSEPTETSLLETECLFGEMVEVIEERSGWVYCKLNTDNYCGWIKKEGLRKLNNPTHRVIVKRSFIYINKNPKSNTLFYLPMGARISVKNIKFDWAEISFYYNNKFQTGYVPKKHIVELHHKVKDWVNVAQRLEDTPYKWGGRDTIGLDCSALLQLSYQTYGEVLPRNTSQQIQLNKKNINNICDLKRGCVVFWRGHVGIMIDNKNCIHANSFHMSTVTEPLFDIINRMGNYHQIVKMMDFN
tara:strand:+ start:873 stop:1628 length:756 start_codon:yes stop_codon:yes gene_type:complete